MKFFQILFLSASLLMSCKPKTDEAKVPEMPANADVTTYETEIMKIHDVAMPKMTDLNKLETALRNIRTEAGHSELGSAAIPQGLDDMIAQVKATENGMLDWMEYYTPMRAKLQPDVMLEFMKQELVKITQVNKNIDDTIEKAKAWLAAHPS
ncbi:MAG: hypothetical protein WBP41_03225 [Saprospiraceae bacterium]